jgi:hypothetical protein
MLLVRCSREQNMSTVSSGTTSCENVVCLADTSYALSEIRRLAVLDCRELFHARTQDCGKGRALLSVSLVLRLSGEHANPRTGHVYPAWTVPLKDGRQKKAGRQSNLVLAEPRRLQSKRISPRGQLPAHC